MQFLDKIHTVFTATLSSWSQRGAKVNGSHHGDNPLLKPKGIQIMTKPAKFLGSGTGFWEFNYAGVARDY